MNTDAAFTIGKTHAVCQDYAIAGKNSIVISDGCSGSAFSDIGSRILSITAMSKMAELCNLEYFDGKECVLLANPIIKMLNLPKECLDATLFGATVFPRGLDVIGQGDGTIAVKTKNEDIVVIDISYEDNHPFYMNYLYDNRENYIKWREKHNKQKTEIFTIRHNGDIDRHEDRSCPMDKIDIGTFCYRDNGILLDIDEDDMGSIEFIAIMSDGIHSFYQTIETETSKQNQPISYFDVLKRLLNFKNYNGRFVQRRLNRFIRDCAKDNWHYADDVSLGVIYVGDQ